MFLEIQLNLFPATERLRHFRTYRIVSSCYVVSSVFFLIIKFLASATSRSPLTSISTTATLTLSHKRFHSDSLQQGSDKGKKLRSNALVFESNYVEVQQTPNKGACGAPGFRGHFQPWLRAVCRHFINMHNLAPPPLLSNPALSVCVTKRA